MLANPSWIAGTELRKKALASSSSNSIKVNTTHGKKVMDAKKCAEAVIKALEEKKLSVFLPKKYSLVPLLRCLAPALIDTIVKTKVDSQLR